VWLSTVVLVWRWRTIWSGIKKKQFVVALSEIDVVSLFPTKRWLVIFGWHIRNRTYLFPTISRIIWSKRSHTLTFLTYVRARSTFFKPFYLPQGIDSKMINHEGREERLPASKQQDNLFSHDICPSRFFPAIWKHQYIYQCIICKFKNGNFFSVCSHKPETFPWVLLLKQKVVR